MKKQQNEVIKMNSSEGDYLYLKAKDFKTKKCVTLDFDGTLFVKANGDRPYTPETSKNNCVFLYGVEEKLNEFINSGILPIIISNQSNITLEKEKMFLAVYNFFKCKITIFAAHKKNEYRKPNPTFLTMLSAKYEILFHSGDAIGNSKFIPYNFSSVDREFAEEGGVPFKSPLKVFGSNFQTVVPEESIVIMKGLPGSGKSSVAKRLEEEEGFTRFSQDEIKDLKLKRNMGLIRLSLIRKEKIVLDATHRMNSLIEPFIALAAEYKVSYVILWCVRDGRPFNELREKPVPNMAYSCYVRDFEEPEENVIIVS